MAGGVGRAGLEQGLTLQHTCTQAHTEDRWQVGLAGQDWSRANTDQPPNQPTNQALVHQRPPMANSSRLASVQPIHRISQAASHPPPQPGSQPPTASARQPATHLLKGHKEGSQGRPPRHRIQPGRATHTLPLQNQRGRRGRCLALPLPSPLAAVCHAGQE